MTKSRIYPLADRTTQWWETNWPRATFPTIEKILLHSTETVTWPTYKAGGSDAPTLTYHPRQRKWRQHCYLNSSARALVDPSSTVVRENRDNVIQIEIIAYADEKVADQVGGLKIVEMTDAQLQDIADFIAYVREEWGGPPLVAAPFQGYPASYGLRGGTNKVRFSGPEFDAFQGILGHQHAPQQMHGDPGAINVKRIIQLATPVAPQPVPPINEGVITVDITPAQLDALIRKAVREEAPRAVWSYRNPNITTLDAYAILRFGKNLPKPPTKSN